LVLRLHDEIWKDFTKWGGALGTRYPRDSNFYRLLSFEELETAFRSRGFTDDTDLFTEDDIIDRILKYNKERRSEAFTELAISAVKRIEGSDAVLHSKRMFTTRTK